MTLIEKIKKERNSLKYYIYHGIFNCRVLNLCEKRLVNSLDIVCLKVPRA